jgi:hypothetical protein
MEEYEWVFAIFNTYLHQKVRIRSFFEDQDPESDPDKDP